MTDQEQPPNSALDVKLDYIQRDIREIKGDIKEIKNEYVPHREFEEAIKVIKDDISYYKKLLYGVFAVFATAIATAIAKLIIK